MTILLQTETVNAVNATNHKEKYEECLQTKEVRHHNQIIAKIKSGFSIKERKKG